MSLVISDLHGNYAKCKAFVEYRADEEIEKIILGDFMDSYHASDADIIATFKLAIDSGCVLTAGNHELPYLSNVHSYFRCSGNRYSPELFHFVNMHKHLLHGAIVRNGYLMTHGGFSSKLARNFKTPEDAAHWINDEFGWYKNQPIAPESLSKIFDIGLCRGGYQDVGGVFWFSIGYEKMSNKFNQIVGHTPRPEPIIIIEGKKPHQVKHVGIDSQKFICYNTETHELEDFYPKYLPQDDETRQMIERRF